MQSTGPGSTASINVCVIKLILQLIADSSQIQTVSLLLRADILVSLDKLLSFQIPALRKDIEEYKQCANKCLTAKGGVNAVTFVQIEEHSYLVELRMQVFLYVFRLLKTLAVRVQSPGLITYNMKDDVLARTFMRFFQVMSDLADLAPGVCESCLKSFGEEEKQAIMPYYLQWYGMLKVMTADGIQWALDAIVSLGMENQPFSLELFQSGAVDFVAVTIDRHLKVLQAATERCREDASLSVKALTTYSNAKEFVSLSSSWPESQLKDLLPLMAEPVTYFGLIANLSLVLEGEISSLETEDGQPAPEPQEGTDGKQVKQWFVKYLPLLIGAMSVLGQDKQTMTVIAWLSRTLTMIPTFLRATFEAPKHAAVSADEVTVALNEAGTETTCEDVDPENNIGLKTIGVTWLQNHVQLLYRFSDDQNISVELLAIVLNLVRMLKVHHRSFTREQHSLIAHILTESSALLSFIANVMLPSWSITGTNMQLQFKLHQLVLLQDILPELLCLESKTTNRVPAVVDFANFDSNRGLTVLLLEALGRVKYQISSILTDEPGVIALNVVNSLERDVARLVVDMRLLGGGEISY